MKLPLHFFKAPKANDNGKTVILIHGLFLRGLGMYFIGRFLNLHGYEARLYDYFTTRKNIAAHGIDFAKYIMKVHAEKLERELYVVTHSLGSIVTREALSLLEKGNMNIIRRVVMLAPPNKGSDAAKTTVSLIPFIGKFVKSLPELSSHKDAYVHKVPVPSGTEIGVIAGKYDMKVAEKYTHIEGEKDHTVVPVSHSLIVINRAAIKNTLKFLNEGKF
ncbi:MAG: hypothetical protein A2020_03015 [Lentisphaerae bacterium GWF2_45_14]|nr:MAG: hypothetical protein A2020_03015 [Lentisphaerae bacterium GWF2_45_14]